MIGHNRLKEKWRLKGKAGLYSFSNFPFYFVVTEGNGVSANWKLELNKVIDNLKVASIHVEPPTVRTALYFLSLFLVLVAI